MMNYPAAQQQIPQQPAAGMINSGPVLGMNPSQVKDVPRLTVIGNRLENACERLAELIQRAHKVGDHLMGSQPESASKGEIDTPPHSSMNRLERLGEILHLEIDEMDRRITRLEEL